MEVGSLTNPLNVSTRVRVLQQSLDQARDVKGIEEYQDPDRPELRTFFEQKEARENDDLLNSFLPDRGNPPPPSQDTRQYEADLEGRIGPGTDDFGNPLPDAETQLERSFPASSGPIDTVSGQSLFAAQDARDREFRDDQALEDADQTQEFAQSVTEQYRRGVDDQAQLEEGFAEVRNQRIDERQTAFARAQEQQRLREDATLERQDQQEALQNAVQRRIEEIEDPARARIEELAQANFIERNQQERQLARERELTEADAVNAFIDDNQQPFEPPAQAAIEAQATNEDFLAAVAQQAAAQPSFTQRAADTYNQIQRLTQENEQERTLAQSRTQDDVEQQALARQERRDEEERERQVDAQARQEFLAAAGQAGSSAAATGQAGASLLDIST